MATQYLPVQELVIYQEHSSCDNKYYNQFYIQTAPLFSSSNGIQRGAFKDVTSDGLEGLLHLFNQHTKQPASILPPNLLAQDSTGKKLLWWLPAEKRPISATENIKKTYHFTDELYNYPPLVFYYENSSLYVYAIQSNARPDENTHLFNAPFLNMTEKGGVCLGFHSINKKNISEVVESLTNAFLSNQFSEQRHPVLGKRLEELWKTAKTVDFPTQNLVLSQETIKNILKKLSQ